MKNKVNVKQYYEENPEKMGELVLLYNMLEVSNLAAAKFVNELSENHSLIFRNELKMLHTRAGNVMNELLRLLYNTVKENGNTTTPITKQAKFVADMISLCVVVPEQDIESTLKSFETIVKKKLKKA